MIFIASSTGTKMKFPSSELSMNSRRVWPLLIYTGNDRTEFNPPRIQRAFMDKTRRLCNAFLIELVDFYMLIDHYTMSLRKARKFLN